MAISTDDFRTLMMLAGGYLVADDFEDFMKFDRVHHWQVGAAMILASLLPTLTPVPTPEPPSEYP